MLPDRVSNPGPLTYESGALLIALRGPALFHMLSCHVIALVSCTLSGNSLGVVQKNVFLCLLLDQ